MSNRIQKALRDGGRITVRIEYNYTTGISYYVQEDAFRLTGIKRGKIQKETLTATADPDALIRDVISEVVRVNHIAWEARKE